MVRYAELDSHEYRLPEGMTRVGYDADSQIYTYQGADGSHWEGPEGARYGELHRVGNGFVKAPLIQDERALKASEKEAWRYMLPFFLLVGVFLLLIIYLTTPYTYSKPGSCTGNSEPYTIVSGDSCWAIADSHKVTARSLQEENPEMECSKLKIGATICVPQGN